MYIHITTLETPTYYTSGVGVCGFLFVTHRYICMYVCKYIYIYIYVYTYMYIYTHMCIHVSLKMLIVAMVPKLPFVTLSLKMLIVAMVPKLPFVPLVLTMPIRSVFKYSCLFLRPRLWQFEI